jgi:4-hydroxy-tetrahydrodipicolinate reductase
MGNEGRIRVVQYGLGPIGAATARLVLDRTELELVGAVDIDPQKIGQDVGRLSSMRAETGVRVVGSLSDLSPAVRADVVLHTTSSFFPLFMNQITEILEFGCNIVSTSEELSFPWLAHAESAEKLSAAAKTAGKTVLGTGVNPGFLMDSLPLFLTGICQRVDRVEVVRAMNASLRRGPFQAKIGSGLSVGEFQQRMQTGRMGHIGLRESTGMIMDSLGRHLDSYTSSVEPIVADRQIRTDHFVVDKGEVRGLRQIAQGFSDAAEFVRLVFVAALDWPENHDEIRISGVPDLEMRLSGTNGDLATVAIAVNAIRRVVDARPGLMTMRDLPPVVAGG